MINYVNPESRRKEIEFTHLVKKYFAPKMILLGWQVVNELNFIKTTNNCIVNVFGFQTNWKEEQDFYSPHTPNNKDHIFCETAIHFDFYSDYEKIWYPFCLVRDRLPRLGEGENNWDFNTNEDKNIEMIDSIWTAFENHSSNFYKDFENFPYPFNEIKPEDIEETDSYKILDKYRFDWYSESARLMKDINLFFGNKSYAESFAEIEKREGEKMKIWESELDLNKEFDNPFL